MLLAKNRKALHEYKIIEQFVAGCVFTGYEIKAIREGKVSFDGAFVTVVGGEPILLNTYIGRYSHQSQPYNENEARKSRKLLLKAAEIAEISKHLEQKGLTAVPLAFVTHKNLIKLELAVVKGLKFMEKRDVEKDRQQKRDMDRDFKEVRLSGER